MERHFERDLEELKERLLWMGSLAERAVHQAVHAVLDADEKLAGAVLREENAINELQIEIDDRVVQLLALQQLMATDLRFVLAIARINNDLEAIGVTHRAPSTREPLRRSAENGRPRREDDARQPGFAGAPRHRVGAFGALS